MLIKEGIQEDIGNFQEKRNTITKAWSMSFLLSLLQFCPQNLKLNEEKGFSPTAGYFNPISNSAEVVSYTRFRLI
jgi:hypothetical protein